MKKNNISGILIFVMLTMFAVIAFYPFYNVLIISFAKYKDVSASQAYLLPKSFDLSSYAYILKNKEIINGFLVSTVVTICGVVWNMFLSTTAAYALSKKGMPGRNIMLTLIIFTMLFSGGLIPYYLLIKNMGLIDSIMSMIIPTGINTFYLIIMKNYFTSLPESLEEAAKIDGANDIYILIRIVLPISAPIIATFFLFYGVDRWNEWWSAFLFISSPDKQPIQIVLRNILIAFSSNVSVMQQAMMSSRTTVFIQSLQMAAIVVAVLPMMIIFPFLQKYFVKGIMIGSLKD